MAPIRTRPCHCRKCAAESEVGYILCTPQTIRAHLKKYGSSFDPLPPHHSPARKSTRTLIPQYSTPPRIPLAAIPIQPHTSPRTPELAPDSSVPSTSTSGSAGSLDDPLLNNQPPDFQMELDDPFLDSGPPREPSVPPEVTRTDVSTSNAHPVSVIPRAISWELFSHPDIDDLDDSEVMDEDEVPAPRNSQAERGAAPHSPEPLENATLRNTYRDSLGSQTPPEDESDSDDEFPPSEPKAFSEAPQIRLAYLQAVIANIFNGRTVLDATEQLNDTLDVLSLVDGLPTTPKPATTLLTARRRVGLDIDKDIEQRPICTVCFKYYSPETIKSMELPKCTEPRCKGIVYREEQTKHGVKRVPAKIQPYSSIIKFLRRLFARPGFVQLLRDQTGDEEREDRDDGFVMQDIYDGDAWIAHEVGLQRNIGLNGRVLDQATSRGSIRKLVKNRFGLNGTINIDWFGLAEGRPHSCGGVYIAINNILRPFRFLTRFVHLCTTIPGPHEPSLLQLNHCISPAVDELMLLYTGIQMQVYNSQLPPRIGDRSQPRSALENHSHSDSTPASEYRRSLSRAGEPHPGYTQELVELLITMQNSDLPAARKFSGSAACTHKTQMCDQCDCPLEALDMLIAYDIPKFKFHQDSARLEWAFKSMTAKTKSERKAILDDHGVRHSLINHLPNWHPTKCSPVDLMHNIFGIVHHFHSEVIVKSHLLNTKKWDIFEKTQNAVLWPSAAGRLPRNMGENHSLKKADEWRRHAVVLPFILWQCWHDAEDTLSEKPDGPVAANAKYKPTFKRNPRELFKAALLLSVSCKVLAAHSISKHGGDEGQTFLQQFCQLCVSLEIPMRPNHHMAMHYARSIRLYGPVYGWWLFAFERFNGILEDVNTNGHASGEMELTLMRNWLARQRVYEILISLPETATDKERDLLKRVLARGGGDGERGTLRTQFAGFNAGTAIQTSKRGRLQNLWDKNLQESNLYILLLAHARQVWPQRDIQNDFTIGAASVFFGATSATLHDFIVISGTRYGSARASRASEDCYSYAEFHGNREPVQIMYHFELKISGESPVLCSVVRKFKRTDDMPSMPWDLYALELGLTNTLANKFEHHEVIASTALSSRLVVIELSSSKLRRKIWVALSYDRMGAEPEEPWEEDELDGPFGDEV